MNFKAHDGNEQNSECRALVPLAGAPSTSPNARWVSAAPFVVQLAANVKGFAAYRAKRRADPADGTNSYRATMARAVVLPPLGSKLNYCA